jgi:hypothetical protein
LANKHKHAGINLEASSPLRPRICARGTGPNESGGRYRGGGGGVQSDECRRLGRHQEPISGDVDKDQVTNRDGLARRPPPLCVFKQGRKTWRIFLSPPTCLHYLTSRYRDFPTWYCSSALGHLCFISGKALFRPGLSHAVLIGKLQLIFWHIVISDPLIWLST